MKSEIKKLLEKISAFEETAILALDASGLPPEAGSVATVLKQNRKNIWELWAAIENEEQTGGYGRNE